MPKIIVPPTPENTYRGEEKFVKSYTQHLHKSINCLEYVEVQYTTG